MKKTLLVLIAFFTITLASAQFTDGDYTFTVVGSDAFVSATTATGDVTFPTSATDSATSTTYNVTGVASAFNSAGNGASITSVIIPLGYKTFQANCFRSMTSMNSIVFLDGETFGDKAFRNVDSLESVVLPPNEITSFGIQMFWQSDNLTSVDLGGLTSLPNGIFKACPGMTTLTIPATLTAFDAASFQGSTVVTLIVEGSVPATIDALWEGVPANITAYVPTENVTDYQNAAIWKDMIIKDKAILSDPQVVVNTLADFKTAVQFSDREVTLSPGNYNLENDLPIGSRVITLSGSNNNITLTGAYIQVPVGCVGESYMRVTGNNNTIIGGEIEDTYRNGLTEITDFSAYNQDRTNLAYGLGGDAVMTISGTDNLLDGLTLTTRGSFPYGYGSMYGIGAGSTFGLNKRCGILLNGPRNTIDNVVLHQRAFGHGIFMQGDATETVIKNTSVDGRVRPTGDLYSETNTYDLPYRANYQMPFEDNRPLPTDEYHSLCEDAFRAYTGSGSTTVENCTAYQMRGGFRFYLGGAATISNSTATDCGSSNFNLPANSGVITNSSGNFAYAPLTDNAGSKNGYKAEWTIIPSPHATGPHNIMDLTGSNHNIVLHRTPGPIDTTDRAIVVTGDNSTIVNETEYPIILESTANGNTIRGCEGATITDNGTNNTIILSDCGGLLSVHSNSLADNIHVLPNPVINELTVSLTNTNLNNSDTKISLYNIKGQKVLEVSPINNNNPVLNVSNLQSGIYVLKISDNASVFTKKIVKL
ncbi:putative secreted protein (Por secretion system target) [Mariniflexile fucanivorans]|uniref:Putative secreted protein (Por secretion system target) n=1 Tax=Mariniflexile fucanivorans TaxID=264023 RepID=A0A4R1RKJ4_9FLAO|nr:leucine-rich repeat domain-containing protein [Mariniflexile fucanivorans]TCL66232.1 putative secreted protein (Por secretion system target) [Mariniflexile fucanivorans]